MLSLVYFVLASLVSAESAPFDCSKNDYKTELACVSTKWCVWNTAGTPAPNCVIDPCVKYIADIDDTDSAACQADTLCGLYYITDIHNCTDGSIINQTDLFCRVNNIVYHKTPLDSCFYQDLKSRAADATAKKCANLDGGVGCNAVTSGDNYYCDSTGEPTCSQYLDDGDLSGFCNCLKPDRCNLYPGCAISKESGGPCVVDPCADANISSGACVGNLAGINTCVVANVMEVVNNALIPKAYCVSADNSTTVKKNDYNPCYYGISQSVAYPAWDTKKESSECATVTVQDQCAGINTVTCEAKPIAAGWFSSAQGNYCSDNQNRNIPSPDGSSVLRLPSILFLLSVFLVVLF